MFLVCYKQVIDSYRCCSFFFTWGVSNSEYMHCFLGPSFAWQKIFYAGGEVSHAIPLHKITIERNNLLGSGSTSRVFKGIYREGESAQHVVAVKEFNVPLTRTYTKKIDLEAKCLTELSHPNVLRYFGRGEDGSCMISEYLGKSIKNADGDIKEVNNVRQLLDEKEEEIPWAVRLHVALKAAKGLKYLHDNGCVHCDFKASNVFIGGEEEEMLIKIGDFGESTFQAKEYVFYSSISPRPISALWWHHAICGT